MKLTIVTFLFTTNIFKIFMNFAQLNLMFLRFNKIEITAAFKHITLSLQKWIKLMKTYKNTIKLIYQN